MDKDYFRAMKTEKLVSSKKGSHSFSQNKFKNKAQLIFEELQKPEVPADRLYIIDKVVRMRGKEGRFGVDHSEILNFEFELANKERSDHMNKLASCRSQLGENKENSGLPDDTLSSTVLFQRLSQKEQAASRQEASKRSGSKRRGLSFNEWVRRKEAEKRMKQRLVREVKDEIRQELIEIA